LDDHEGRIDETLSEGPLVEVPRLLLNSIYRDERTWSPWRLRYRGTVALFFRWFNGIFVARSLVCGSTVRRPNAPTTCSVSLSGWASTREVLTQVERSYITALPGKKWAEP